MRSIIEEKLLAYFKKCSVDNYGQTSVADPYVVFGKETEDILKYLKTDTFIRVKCYGGRYGTYYGFSLSYDVLDKQLQKRCWDMLKQNKNYQWAMTH